MTNRSYDTEFRRQLDALYEGLSANLELLPILPSETSEAVLTYLLELACQAQNTRNIDLGRMALLRLPTGWLVERIEQIAEPLLQLNDEWEYRRLLEVYERLDSALTQRLAARGMNSDQPDIRATAQEYFGHVH
jgi:hypothetical protein